MNKDKSEFERVNGFDKGSVKAFRVGSGPKVGVKERKAQKRAADLQKGEAKRRGQCDKNSSTYDAGSASKRAADNQTK